MTCPVTHAASSEHSHATSGDVGGRPDAAGREPRRELRPQGVVDPAGVVGARADGVDGDLQVGDLGGELAREGLQRALGRRVGQLAGHRPEELAADEAHDAPRARGIVVAGQQRGEQQQKHRRRELEHYGVGRRGQFVGGDEKKKRHPRECSCDERVFCKFYFLFKNDYVRHGTKSGYQAAPSRDGERAPRYHFYEDARGAPQHRTDRHQQYGSSPTMRVQTHPTPLSRGPPARPRSQNSPPFARPPPDRSGYEYTTPAQKTP
jgi:hypothetical protein